MRVYLRAARWRQRGEAESAVRRTSQKKRSMSVSAAEILEAGFFLSLAAGAMHEEIRKRPRNGRLSRLNSVPKTHLYVFRVLPDNQNLSYPHLLFNKRLLRNDGDRKALDRPVYVINEAKKESRLRGEKTIVLH